MPLTDLNGTGRLTYSLLYSTLYRAIYLARLFPRGVNLLIGIHWIVGFRSHRIWHACLVVLFYYCVSRLGSADTVKRKKIWIVNWRPNQQADNLDQLVYISILSSLSGHERSQISREMLRRRPADVGIVFQPLSL